MSQAGADDFLIDLFREEDAVVGEGVRLARDVHDDCAEHGEGDRQLHLKSRPAPRLGVKADVAADRLDHGLDHVQAHAAPGDPVTSAAVETPGRKRKSSSSASVSRWAISAVACPRWTTLPRRRWRSIPRPSSETVIESSPAL